MRYNNNFYACIEIFNISIIKNNITSLRVRNYIRLDDYITKLEIYVYIYICKLFSL